ncbi:molybdenum cofactor guanylyltransferase MobA [Endothiovibrio diazotrophicus]
MAVPPIARQEITGILLAGGEGRRVGGADKGLLPFHGRPLVEVVLARLTPQVGRVVISANRNLEQYGGYGWPVVADEADHCLGPLAGVVAALGSVTSPFAMVVPCDAPCLPENLVARLASALGEREVALPDDGERRQYAFALLRSAIRPWLAACLESGNRGLGRCFATRRTIFVDCRDEIGGFRNLNSLNALSNLCGR